MTQGCIFLTRPAERNLMLAHDLYESGINHVQLPALAINFQDAACPVPQPGEIVIFVSRNAVLGYFSNQTGVWPATAKACAVGKVTADELAEFLPASQIIAPGNNTASDSEALLGLIDQLGLRPSTAHIMRAQSGRDWLSGQLQDRGWKVCFYTVYQRERIIWSKSDCELFVRARPAILLLTSKQAFEAIDNSLKSYNLEWPDRLCVITLHQRIADCLQYEYTKSDKILDVTVTKPDDESLLQALIQAFNNFHK